MRQWPTTDSVRHPVPRLRASRPISMTAGETVAVVRRVVIDRRADRRTGCVACGAANETGDHGANEFAEYRAQWLVRRSSPQRRPFHASERGGHVTCHFGDAANCAIDFAVAIEYIYTRRKATRTVACGVG
ncbi:hypothetical protein [Burkholderia contaminans]|uniref:hypothetical protein n=1 Tax=Burkholderia contaminans TaxID=488447 RepID=UPI001629FC44|nr:hypothetical protein [Burkholderia contaminans]